MFPYDSQLAALLVSPPTSIAGVLAIMQSIDLLTVDGDGLKWFNWLYLQVTKAVETRVASGGFTDAAYLAELDVQFAELYFNALAGAISDGPIPDCWQTLFAQRNQLSLARIQFALAGINAHINHDLPIALVATARLLNVPPAHGTVPYEDYTSLNSTLDSLIEEAKQALHVRLLGDSLPDFAALEDTIAAWSVSAAREAAWNNAELLWRLESEPQLADSFLTTLDGLTTVVGKGLLIPVP